MQVSVKKALEFPTRAPDRQGKVGTLILADSIEHFNPLNQKNAPK